MSKKRMVWLAMAACLCMAATAFAAQEYPVPEVRFERRALPQTRAMAFVQNMAPGWNLGNTFDACSDTNTLKDELQYETSWVGVKTTRENILALKSAGIRTLRIPVSWHNHMSDDFTISAVWLERVREVVDWAYAEGMVVILNIHHDTMQGYYYPTRAHMETSARFIAAVWTQLSSAFADYGENLVFESINEPRLKGTRFEWSFQRHSKDCQEAAACINELNQLMVDTVRAGGGKNDTRYIMVPAYAASPDNALLPLFVMPKDSADDRLILSVHAYTPYNFALQAKGEQGSTDAFRLDAKAQTNIVSGMMTKLYNTFVKQGVPVVIGEFGARDKGGNTQSRVDFTAYYVAAARASGIPCIWWDNGAFAGSGELFGLLRRVNNTWIYPDILEAMVTYSR